jgi:hypothetical protein
MNAQLTRQGVRNLNGPKLDGRYNGRRTDICPHKRSPDYPVTRSEGVRPVELDGIETLKKVSIYLCSACGEERWFE